MDTSLFLSDPKYFEEQMDLIRLGAPGGSFVPIIESPPAKPGFQGTKGMHQSKTKKAKAKNRAKAQRSKQARKRNR